VEARCDVISATRAGVPRGAPRWNCAPGSRDIVAIGSRIGFRHRRQLHHGVEEALNEGFWGRGGGGGGGGGGWVGYTIKQGALADSAGPEAPTTKPVTFDYEASQAIAPLVDRKVDCGLFV